MLFSSTRFTCLTIVVALLNASPTYASIASNWTNPNARLPSFSSTYLVGERILLSWLALNQSRNDLWLTRYDVSTDDFALRIASDVDISDAGSFAWTIAVSDTEVLMDTRFEFQFVTTGSNYDPTAPTEFSSPGFNLMLVNQIALPNGTATSTTTSALETAAPSTSSTSSTTTSSDPPPPPNPSSSDTPGVSTAGIAGIAVGALAAVGLIGFVIGYMVFKKRQARHKPKAADNLDVTMTGPYEILGDRRHPTEVLGKEAEVHEMNASKETIVAEAGGSQVHEVGNTMKRPGLHEMPG